MRSKGSAFSSEKYPIYLNEMEKNDLHFLGAAEWKKNYLKSHNETLITEP